MSITLFFAYLFILLLISTLLFYWAYKLIAEGLFTEKGEFYDKYGKKHILIKKALPGFCFFILGALLLLCTINKGSKKIDILISPCPCCSLENSK